MKTVNIIFLIMLILSIALQAFDLPIIKDAEPLKKLTYLSVGYFCLVGIKNLGTKN